MSFEIPFEISTFHTRFEKSWILLRLRGLAKLRDILNIEEGEEDDDQIGAEDDEERKVTVHADGTASAREDKPFVPFSISLDDPSGNSFFQFKDSPSDPQWNMRAYNRTFDQNVTLGLVARPDDMPEQQPAGQAIVDNDHKLSSMEEFEERRKKMHENDDKGNRGVVPEEIFSFPSTCSSCGHELETLMQQVNIPYFQVSNLRRVKCSCSSQNIIIMATNCYACGYRDNEVKSGGAVAPKGKKISLKIEDEEDLSRDLLKVSLLLARLRPILTIV